MSIDQELFIKAQEASTLEDLKNAREKVNEMIADLNAKETELAALSAEIDALTASLVDYYKRDGSLALTADLNTGGFGVDMGAGGIGNDNPVLTFAAGAAGKADFTGDVGLADDKKLTLGTGDDLEIYTSADIGIIRNVTSGKAIKYYLNVGGVDTISTCMCGTNDNVGIGTDAPNSVAKLHVYSAGNTSIWCERASGAIGKFDCRDTYVRLGAHSNHDLRLLTNNSAVVYITTGNLVGIMNNSPAEVLDVTGTVKATGYKALSVGVTYTGYTGQIDTAVTPKINVVCGLVISAEA